ncbi:ExbD/TolR family protein [Hydrogenophaga sp. A37]|uniref:ExbD/TolR family protein n=1 Tax=Hydrogenophaga sp. A37 TaxID=1945864 RepID=UPI000984E65D|nr:biopolymer transporter ExbD [Hydrogenophaga sp. A37]OOG83828.1 biopolymer transporter ExbD [Hydrogenophaga sp. A37]
MSFGRLEKPARHEPMSDINVTPLVDVMLVLLVIFIITAPLMSSRLELELPKASEPVAASAEPEAFISISVDPQGQVFWDEQPVDPAELKKRLTETAQRNPETELQLRADTAVPYGRVVQLIGLAQSVGLSRIGFVADPATGEATAPAPTR